MSGDVVSKFPRFSGQRQRVSGVMRFLQHAQPLRVKLFQPRANALRQFRPAEVNILHGRVNTAVSRKGGDVVQFNARSCQVGQAQMTQRVGSELRHLG